MQQTVLKKCLSDTEFVNMQIIFQKMLCYREWLKRDKYWKRNDENAIINTKIAIEKLLKSIVNLFPRMSGQNWEIAKMHEQLHVA